MEQQPRLETQHAASPRTAAPLSLRIGFWVSIGIAVAVVIRRLVAIAHPSSSGPPQMASLDAFFASHAALTLAHIVPALLFVLLIPLYFSRKFGDALWLERLLFSLGAIVGITAYAMSADPVGGWLERSAVLFFNSFYLFSLARSYWHQRSDRRAQGRHWMTRAIGILLGIATTRPVMGVFFATSPLTHLQPKQFFGIAFWIGFSINAIVVELWLRRRGSPFHSEGLASYPNA